MNRVIVSLILASGVVSVYADDSLYGIAGVVITSQDTEQASGADTNPGIQVNSGGASTSRFGVRGSKEIANGMEVIYKLEGGVGIDDGSFSGFTRNSWVGLSGRYGSLSAGLHWTPYDDAYFEIDVQEYASWAAQYLVINNTKSLGNIGSHGDTFSREDSLIYNSPNWNGVTLGVMYAPGEDGETASESSRYTGFRLAYNNESVDIQFSGESQRPLGVSVTNTDAWLLGGSYDTGPAKIFLGYQSADGFNGEDEGFSLGIATPVYRSTTLRVGYARDKTTNASGETINNGVVEGVSVDVVYNLAPDLDLYALAARVTGKVDGESAESTYQEYGVALRYKF